jgi:hypothetical protein
LFLLVRGDIARRGYVKDLAARDGHFMLSQSFAVWEGLLASLAVRLIMFAVKMLPGH